MTGLGLRFRGRGRGRGGGGREGRRGEGGGGREGRRGEAGGRRLLGFLSLFSFCICRRRSSKVHPDLAAAALEEEGFPGRPAHAGGAVAVDVATLGSTGECSLSADSLSPGNCTLGSLGTCSLSVGDAFCGRSYDNGVVTVSLDGVFSSGVGPSAGGRLIFFHLLFYFHTLYLVCFFIS